MVQSLNGGAESAIGGGGGAVVLISGHVLSSPAASFTFSSIPATYTDLYLVCDGQGNSGASTAITIKFNSDTSASYSQSELWGSGTTTSTAGQQVATYLANNINLINWPGPTAVTPGYAGALTMNIQDYKNTVFYKTFTYDTSQLVAESSGNAYVIYSQGWWKNLAAINRIDVMSGTGSFVTGSRCSLYGRY